MTGSIDTLRAPEGDLELALTRSRVREWVIDSVFGRGGVRDSVIRLDTAYAEWQGARAAGAGTLGWAAPHGGEMQFALDADSLIGFDSLLLAATGQQRDTSPDARPARRERAGHGAARRESRYARGVRRSRGRATSSSSSIAHPLITAASPGSAGRRPQLTASATADSIAVGELGRSAERPARRAATPTRSHWALGSTAARQHAGGRRRGSGTSARQRPPCSGSTRCTPRCPRHGYRLLEPRRHRPPRLGAADRHAGHAERTGRLGAAARRRDHAGRSSPAQLTLEVLGLDLQRSLRPAPARHDRRARRGRARSSAGGTAGPRRSAGTAASGRRPVRRFPVALRAGRAELRRSPSRREPRPLAHRREDPRGRGPPAAGPRRFGRWSSRRLRGPALGPGAQPTAWTSAILEALTPAVRQVRGPLAADVQVEGTWERAPPRGARSTIRNGSMTLPGSRRALRLGRTAGPCSRAIRSCSATCAITSGGGTLAVGGAVRLEDLSRPILDLDFRARSVPRDRRPQLPHPHGDRRSPAARPDLRLDPDRQPDGQQRRALLRRPGQQAGHRSRRSHHRRPGRHARSSGARTCGAQFQNRFLDSLRIDDLRVAMGSDVWLRSAEANIQLDGNVRREQGRQDVSADRDAQRAARQLHPQDRTGHARLHREHGETCATSATSTPGSTSRRATPCDAVRGDEIPVIANIEGTLYAAEADAGEHLPAADLGDRPGLLPDHRLSRRTRPPCSDSRARCRPAWRISPARSRSELERALIQDIGVPDRPDRDPARGVQRRRRTGTAHPARRRMADRPQDVRDLQRRLLPRLQPVQLPRTSARASSSASAGSGSSRARVEPTDPVVHAARHADSDRSSENRYQIGFDILWEREF